ncbi:hypothetical protein [Streptococcus infantis]|uniref:hypothetical protein n=1 Tax=Streptococcus infantis TaxID=68892 RepID=UPI0039C0890D
MDCYRELDRVLSQPYLGDAFYDADVEYVMDVLLPFLKQGEWCVLGACLEEKSSLYKYKLAYCIEGYDTSNAFNILMNLILCHDKNILEEVLQSFTSFDSSKYREQLITFPQVISILKGLSSCKENPTIGRLSTSICETFGLQ